MRVGNPMNVVISRNNFFEALQRLQSVIVKKTTRPILSNILCITRDKIMSLCATDLEMGIEVLLPFEVGTEGKMTFSAKNLLDIVREFPESPLNITKKENNLIELRCGKSKFQILSLAAEEYPSFPSFEKKQYIEASAQRVLEMIGYTSFCISEDARGLNFGGVCLEQLENGLTRMVATDRNRMSCVDQEAFLNPPDIKKSIVIPKKGLIELGKILSELLSPESSLDENKEKTVPMTKLFLAIDRGYLFAKFGCNHVFMRLMDMEYPDYRLFFPKDLNHVATIDRADFTSALKRVSLFSNEKSRSVVLGFKENLLTIDCNNSSLGEAHEEISIDYGLEPMDMTFNSQFILDCLEVLKSEKIELRFKDKDGPTTLKALDEPNFLYVIMPIRVS